MTNSKSTKRALLSSVVALLVCFTMLLGTTYAWFTDSVTSANNIIQTGTLDVSLEHADTVLGVDDEGWVDASTGSIFSYDKWEPGYTAVKYVKVENEGTLDLKFILNIIPNAAAEDVNLADVIEVYMVDGAVAVDRAALTTDSAAYVGTLTSLINENDGAAHGVLYADDADKAGNVYEIYTIALKMSTSAGNEYMGKSVGGGFAVQLLATQLASESDSFDNQYDKDVIYPELATVITPESGTEVKLSTDTVTVTVPASATMKGDAYEIVLSDKNIVTNSETGETTVEFDLTMYKNDAKVSDDTIYEVTMNLAPGTFISTVTHNGVELKSRTSGADQTYNYDFATGELKIYTKSFSPFTVSYNDYKDYVRKLNIAHTTSSYISASTGSDFLPFVAVNPEITGYSVYDGDTRIANAVHFRFSDVSKDTIDENSYKVSFELAIKDENGNDLTLKPGMPSTINGKEYLHVYVNLLEIPDGYSVTDVKVNGTSLTKTTTGNPTTGEYWLGYNVKDIYLQTNAAGVFEFILTKTN